MNFLNFWSRPIELAAGATALELDLPDGSYRLTVADALAGASAWEIIDAQVVGGTAELTRAREGTDDLDWPAGSLIYCSVTAGLLADVFDRLAQLEARVAALEGSGGRLMVTVGQYVESSSQTKYGFVADPAAGSISPGAVVVPGFGSTSVLAAVFDDFGRFKMFTFTLAGEHPQAALESVQPEGCAVLDGAAADFYSGDGATSWWWIDPAIESFWAVNEQRYVTPVFA